MLLNNYRVVFFIALTNTTVGVVFLLHTVECSNF